jgi:transposase
MVLYALQVTEWLPSCRIIYDKFHIMKHASAAVDEIRRAEFFRKGGPARELVKGKRWLLLTRWVHLTARRKQQLNELFALNRRIMKAYLLKESLDRLWSYHYEGSMMRYLKSWIDQLRWQRLKPRGCFDFCVSVCSLILEGNRWKSTRNSSTSCWPVTRVRRT